MQDKLNARLMGVAPTGNGRESYAHLPMPRMTNTYMLPGEHTPEEIIATVEKGASTHRTSVAAKLILLLVNLCSRLPQRT